jgi:hypothetical protein
MLKQAAGVEPHLHPFSQQFFFFFFLITFLQFFFFFLIYGHAWHDDMTFNTCDTISLVLCG